MEILDFIRDWTEVWALLIPLSIILLFRSRIRNMHPIVLYVWFALILNTTSSILYAYHDTLPAFLKNNNILYNIHSFLRVAFFSIYIYHIRKHRYSYIYKVILSLYILFVIINFIYFDPILFFSTRLFAAESIVLLSLCLAFFVRSMQDDSEINWLKHPAFLICSGISFYEAVSFFIFLLYYPISAKDLSFIKVMWTLHNFTLVILCLTIALALYSSKKREIILQKNEHEL